MPADPPAPTTGQPWVLPLPGAEPDPAAPATSPRHLHLLPVPGATFRMHASPDPADPSYDPEAGYDEGPPRLVTAVDGWLGAHPVTNGQYRSFVAATGHRRSRCDPREAFEAEAQPVTGVDWHDARAFCAWVAASLPPGLTCDLPGEAEWERAARGDDARRFPWGDAPPSPATANFDATRWLHAIGGRPAGAGPFGHHDLAGLVWEWCADLWVDPDDPPDPEDGPERVVRGGSWDEPAWTLRATFRRGKGARSWWDGVGLRVWVGPR